MGRVSIREGGGRHRSIIPKKDCMLRRLGNAIRTRTKYRWETGKEK